MKSATPLQDPKLEWQAAKRRRWLYGVASQRLSTQPLQWGQLGQARWLSIAAIVALHVVVLSGVIYFNSHIEIPMPPAVPVGVVSESAPADDATTAAPQAPH